jgi:hypothetical protein
MNKDRNFASAGAAISVGIVLCSLNVIGCGADQGQSAPQDGAENAALQQYLVAEAKLPGYTVSFYELEPGSLLEFEKGELASRIAEPPNLNAVQRYEFLTDQKAPAALVTAMQRATGGAAEVAPTGTQVAEEQGQSVEAPKVANKTVGWADEAWFRSTYCVQTDRTFGNFDGTYWGGDSTWRGSGVNYLRGGAYNAWAPGDEWDPGRDDISYRMGYSGGNIPDQWYGLQIGQYAAWRNSSTIGRTASSAVRDADTNWYVHCINYHF